MKKTVVFIDPLRVYGGVETFILRLTQWLHESEYRIIVISEENINESIRKTMSDFHAELLLSPVKADGYDFPDLPISFSDDEEVIVLAFYYSTYLIAEHLRYLCPKNNMDIFFYVPHPYAAIGEYWLKRWPAPLKKVAAVYYKAYFKKLYKNQQLIFMDEPCFHAVKTAYKIKSDSFLMARLPMFVDPFSDERAYTSYETENFNILTIGRFEFPMKGYIVNLVDEFAKVFPERKDARLTIVGDGRHKGQLLAKIESQPPEVQKAITLTGQVSYDRLNQYIDEANLFLGMGTTVLDASNRGVPSVVPCNYQSDTCECLGYFYQEPWNLGYKYSELQGFNMAISDELLERVKLASFYIRKVINMTREEYFELCHKSHQAVVLHYDIERIMPQLLSFKNVNTKPRLNWFKIQGIRILYRLLRIAKLCKRLFKKEKKH